MISVPNPVDLLPAGIPTSIISLSYALLLGRDLSVGPLKRTEQGRSH